MDLTTMLSKLESNLYCSVMDFKVSIGSMALYHCNLPILAYLECPDLECPDLKCPVVLVLSSKLVTQIWYAIYVGAHQFLFVEQSDFILMCNNAMTYNAPETVYYATAKRLLSSGLQIIAKVTTAL